MFGLPIWAIQLIIAGLKATGAVSWAGELSLRLIAKTQAVLANIKTYHEQSDFPSHKNSGL